MFGVLLFLGFSFQLGSVCPCLPRAERGVQGGYEQACTSPSLASIAPCGADPARCSARASSSEAAGLKQVERNQIQRELGAQLPSLF